MKVLYLLIFVWSPRSEEWPRYESIDKNGKILHALKRGPECTSWICNVCSVYVFRTADVTTIGSYSEALTMHEVIMCMCISGKWS